MSRSGAGRGAARALAVASTCVLAWGAAACQLGSGERQRDSIGDASPGRVAAQVGSEALFARALDELSRFRDEDAVRLLRDAWDAEPGHLAAFLEVYDRYGPAHVPDYALAALSAFADTDPDQERGVCLGRLVDERLDRVFAGPSGPQAAPRDACAGLRAYVHGAPPRGDPPPLGRAMVERYPLSPAVHRRFVPGLEPGARLAYADSLIHRDLHPLVEAYGHFLRFDALHRLGRHAEATDAERTARRRAGGWPPAARLRLWSELAGHTTYLTFAPDETLVAHVERVAGEAWEESLEIAHAADPAKRTQRLLEWGERLLDDGRLRESVDVLGDLLALADRLGDERLAARVRVRRGRAYVKLGELEAGRDDLLAGRDLAHSSAAVTWQLEAEHNLLHLYEGLRRPDEARRAGAAFAALANGMGVSDLRMMSRRDVARFHRSQGDHEAARRLYAAMVADIDSLGDHRFFAGEFHESAGDLEMALVYYRLALRDHGEITRAYAALARVSEALGDSAQALRFARLHDVGIAGYPEYAPILPGTLARAGRVEEAGDLLDEARARGLVAGGAAGWARLTLELAELRLAIGAAASARSLADSASEAADRVADEETRLRAEALAGLAAAASGAGCGAAGPGRIGRAVRGAAELAAPGLEAELLAREGEALLRCRRPAAGLAALGRAMILIDSVATSLVLDPERARYRARLEDISNLALHAVLPHAAITTRESVTDAYATWSTRRKRAAPLPRRATAVPEALALRDRDLGFSLVEGRRDDPLRRSDAPAYRDLIAGIEPAPSRSDRQPEDGAVPSSPGANRAIVDYAVLDSAVAALVVTSSGATLHRLPTDQESIARWASRLRTRIAPTIGGALDLNRASFDAEAAARLYEALLEPLETRLAAVSHLTIVPDGPLHLVPFDALVIEMGDGAERGHVIEMGDGAERGQEIETGDGAERRYVLDRYAVSIAPDLSAAAARPTAGAGRILTVAPGDAAGAPIAADREVDEISRIFGDEEVVSLHGPRATEARLRIEAGRARVLHLAAHARPNDREPAFARLLMTPEGADDGSLHAFEIRRLRLPGSLVVLSACDTGAGAVVGGEGPLSLARAFLQAGASATIATLWPVGEESVALMREFYGALAAGAAPEDALVAAKRALRDSLRDPRVWAGHILISRAGFAAAG